MKRIIVACGSGIATSGMVATMITNALRDRGLSGKAVIDTADIKNIDSIIQNYDIYVTLTPLASISFEIPTFSGVPFLTGIGADSIMDEIVKLL